jgi:hypothetical protein
VSLCPYILRVQLGYILRISRVLIDSAYTRDIPGINPGYPKENFPFEEKGIREKGLGIRRDKIQSPDGFMTY